MHLFLYLIHENINWDDEKDPFRNRIIDQIENKLGFENLREHIVSELIITPGDWESTVTEVVFNPYTD